MFTGFASENTPAIQVWDFSRSFVNTPRIGLTDDCAPIQFFKTGGNSQIYLYLPSCPIEGKIITIYNASFNSTLATTVYIFCSDVSGAGTTSQIDAIGVGGVLQLCYSKNIISYGPSQGALATGWFPLNRAPYSAINAYSVNNSYLGAASGQSSVVIGGFGITASGLWSACVSGSSNTASATRSAVIGGSNNTASGSESGVFGGSNNTANGNSSFVASGSFGTARSITGSVTFAASLNPITSALGVSQTETLILARQTTDATVTTLCSNNSAAGTTNQVILPNNSAYYVRGSIIATVTGGGNTKSWDFIATIKRGATAASTAIVGAVTLNVQAADAGAATWVVAITADTTNGGLAVTVTGQAATTIRWVAKLESTEVTY